jgi:DNA-binding CsgD family transcriptional regulator
MVDAFSFSRKGLPISKVPVASCTPFEKSSAASGARSQKGGNGGAAGLNRLSHREREVFCRIIQGHSSQAIADALCISVKTVETHRTHINRTLGVRSPVELIRLAALQGLLTGDAPAYGSS